MYSYRAIHVCSPGLNYEAPHVHTELHLGQAGSERQPSAVEVLREKTVTSTGDPARGVIALYSPKILLYIRKIAVPFFEVNFEV